MRVSADLDKHIEWLKEDVEMGFDRVYIHNVNRKQEQFIQMLGKHVLPALRRKMYQPTNQEKILKVFVAHDRCKSDFEVFGVDSLPSLTN